MILRSLEICNIASFENARIDFDAEPLRSADVFLICGNVGSGKSTILDCITLALFGKTPRLDGGVRQTRGRDLTFDGYNITDPRQFLRRGCRSGSVTLRFSHAGHDYEAVWRPVKVQKNMRELTDLTTRVTLGDAAAIDRRISELLGLDFSQFTRTTTLSQGEFAKFLKSDDNDKAMILEKIVGVDIYSRIGRAIFARKADADAAKAKAEADVSNLRVMTDDELVASRELLDTLNAELKAIDLRRSILKAQTDWIDTLATLRTHLTDARSALEAAETRAKAPENSERALLLSDFDRTSDARACHVEAEARRRSIARIEKSIGHDADAFAAILAAMRQLDGRIEADAAALDGLEKELLTHAARTGLYASAESLKSAFTVMTQSAAEADKLRKKLAEADSRITSLREADSAAGAAVGRATDEVAATARKAAAEARCATERLRPQMEEAIAAARKEAETAAADLRTADTIYESLLRATGRDAASMRALLTPGCKCPVCRQTVTEMPESESALAEAYRAAKSQRDTVTDRLDALRRKLDTATSQLAELDSAVADILATPGIADADSSGIDAVDTQGITPASLRALLTAYTAAQNAVVKAQKRKTVTASQLAAVETSKAQTEGSMRGHNDTARREHDRIIVLAAKAGAEFAAEAEADIAAFVSTTAARCDVWQALTDKADKSRRKLDDARALASRLQHSAESVFAEMPQWRGLEPAVRAADAVRLEEMLSTLARDLVANRRMLRSESSALEKAASQLDGFLEANPDFTAERIAALTGLSPDEVTRLRGEADRITRHLEQCRGAVAECEKKLREHVDARPESLNETPEADINAMRNELNDIEKQIVDKNRDAGATARTLEEDAARRESLGALIARRDEAAGLAADWKQLADLFGDKEGHVFRRIALSYVLDSLVDMANAYMRRLTDRYTLALKPGSFIILVVDAYQGYAERAVTTISGGETFMVSLALALALSDVGSNVRGADILFIDEGFGSLSGEELLKAVEMLRTLNRTADRRVGIISHIPQLAECIPVKLTVSRQGNSSASQITIR